MTEAFWPSIRAWAKRPGASPRQNLGKWEEVLGEALLSSGPAKGRLHVGGGEPLTHDLELHGLLGLQVGQVDGADVGPLVAHLSARQLQRDVAAAGVQKEPGPLLRR